VKRLSIITVSLANRAGLEQTLASVAEQDTHDHEFIVVDGGSSDGSRELLERSGSIVDVWISEPDGGIYNAMNKGIRKSTGEYCLFLNAGDRLVETSTVSGILNQLDGNCDVYFSDLRFVDKGKVVFRHYPPSISTSFFLSNTLNHQNTVIRRTALEAAGLYREDLRIASDWYFYIEASLRREARFKKLARPIAVFHNDGVSASAEGSSRNEAERELCLRELFGSALPLMKELASYRDSVYGNIVRTFGASPLLIFLLRAYRAIARILPPAGQVDPHRAR